MKKLALLTILSLATLNSANAALISVGSYAFDDSAAISSISSSTNLSSSYNGTSAITDLDVSTYIVGNGSAAGSAQFDFSRNIYNGSNDDLVLYFLRAAEEPLSASFNVAIGSTTNTYDATLNTFVDAEGVTQKYQVAVNGGFLDLLTATINLDDFGIAADGSITNYLLSGLDGTDRFALGAGFYTSVPVSPVPVPTALVLFLSGIAGLGLFSRRKK